MTIACPACGKKSEDVRECPRCGCELSILEMTTRAAARELFIGRESFLAGDMQSAMHHAGKSWYLKKSPEAARLAFLSALSAASDLAQVDRWYTRASGSAGESGVSQDISLRPTSKIPVC
jgi:predicted amidophosphoribosyltransferase